jgi:hypothetical protein
MTVALYMDQHVPKAVTTGLRRKGVDVLTAFEDGTDQWEDESLLERITQLGRVLFTHDDDFLVRRRRAARMEEVRRSALFRSLAAKHPAVDVWADAGYAEDGWSYFWIVSEFASGGIRTLAYVRLKGGRLERRTYDEAGDDLWVQADE